VPGFHRLRVDGLSVRAGFGDAAASHQASSQAGLRVGCADHKESLPSSQAPDPHAAPSRPPCVFLDLAASHLPRRPPVPKLLYALSESVARDKHEK
jgi:hypothetical protein